MAQTRFQLDSDVVRLQNIKEREVYRISGPYMAHGLSMRCESQSEEIILLDRFVRNKIS